MKKYELTFIVKDSVSQTESENLLNQVKEKIQEIQGNITNEKKVGLRKLAYPIKKTQQGYYFTVYFEAEPKDISDLKEYFKLENQILRYLITEAYRQVGTIDFEAEKQKRIKTDKEVQTKEPVDETEREKKLDQALEKILEQ